MITRMPASPAGDWSVFSDDKHACRDVVNAVGDAGLNFLLAGLYSSIDEKLILQKIRYTHAIRNNKNYYSQRLCTHF